ncbi:hypothetical protein [Flavobacterium sp.]|uniref:hypothetical protein n=1 Tax=Flavobacterium sp. TaxID=239 RepID=UPI00391CF17F
MTAQEIEIVNRALYRPLKSGREFEAVMPRFNGIIHKFDKSTDNNNTFKTLEFMEYWAKKYASQCAKLAKLLQGKTIEQTCKNIYTFLYDHFQYKLDGEAQDLRALSAAWYDRQNGMDCKSYSLIAAKILQNLNIKCAFRMVQLGSPKWSHVYVVVPDGSKYHVIDATTHDNKEVRFTKKYDRNMYHQGLASPITTGLGCSCNGQSIHKTGLGNPGTLAQSIKNLHVYLDHLENMGVSRNVTDTILQIVKRNVQNGVDPNMQQVVQMAVAMNRQQGLGFNFGETASTAVAAYSGDPMAIKSLISKIIPTSFINSTFGAVFANGLNFSCWGASLTPQMATDRIKKTYAPYFEKLINNINNASSDYAKKEAIKEFILKANIICRYYKELKLLEASWSSCAKKAIKEVYWKFFDPVKAKADQLLDLMKSKGATVTLIANNPISYVIPANMTGDGKEYLSKKVTRGLNDVPLVDLSKVDLNQQTQPTAPTQNLVWTENADGTVTVTDTNTGQTATISKEEAIKEGYKPKNETPNSGLSTNAVLGIGAAGLAAFMLFSPKTDVTKSTPQNRSTKTKSKIK